MEETKIVGPVLIPEHKMLRYHPQIGFYHLKCSIDTIAQCKAKFDSENIKTVSINHSSKLFDNTVLTNSFLITEQNQLQFEAIYPGLPLGTWMLEYTITKSDDLRLINDLQLNGFSLEGKFTIIGENGKQYSITEKFRIMNKISELLNFNVYVQGGSTSGAGRNEHGEAHFELKEKNSGKNLGKIFMPSKEKWLGCNHKERIALMEVENGKQLSKREKKVFVQWLEINNSENLLRCHSEWNKINEFNNRTLPI